MGNAVSLALLAGLGVILIFIGIAGIGKNTGEKQKFVEDEYGYSHLVSSKDSSVINSMLADWSKKIYPNSRDLSKRIQKSGYVYANELEYHAKRMTTAIAYLVVVLVFGVIFGISPMTVIILATGATIFGFLTPDRKINSATKKRKESIEREMGFGLERISLNLTSGSNLTTALSSANGIGEFGNVCETLASCINTNQDLNQVIAIIKDDLPNMSLMNEFLELIRQSIIKGQDVSKSFSTTAELLRDRLEMEIVDAGGKAKIKITILTSTFLIIASLLVSVGPLVITLMDLI